MKREHAPELQPSMVFHQSDNPNYICHAKVVGVDGRFLDFSIDRDLGHIIMVEIMYYLKRHEERNFNASVQIPPKKT